MECPNFLRNRLGLAWPLRRCDVTIDCRIFCIDTYRYCSISINYIIFVLYYVCTMYIIVYIYIHMYTYIYIRMLHMQVNVHCRSTWFHMCHQKKLSCMLYTHMCIYIYVLGDGHQSIYGDAHILQRGFPSIIIDSHPRVDRRSMKAPYSSIYAICFFYFRMIVIYCNIIYLWLFMYISYIWGNYNDLTATSLESWLIRGVIPTWPYFRSVNYCNLPRYIYIYMGLSENRVYSQWNSHFIGIMIINHWV